MTSTGNGKRPSRSTSFWLVRDADEAPGRRRDDLFARERRAATLDQVQVAGGFVRAVDVKVEFAGRR